MLVSREWLSGPVMQATVQGAALEPNEVEEDGGGRLLGGSEGEEDEEEEEEVAEGGGQRLSL